MRKSTFLSIGSLTIALASVMLAIGCGGGDTPASSSSGASNNTASSTTSNSGTASSGTSNTGGGSTTAANDNWERPAAPPDPYDSMTNPKAGDAEALAFGKQLYNQGTWMDSDPIRLYESCVTCHGPEGKGDGTKNITSGPKPADFTSEELKDLPDSYFFWRIRTGAEGRKGSLMPSFKTDIGLSDDDIWCIVTYLRSLHGK